MAERIGIDINMSGLSEAVAGLSSVSQAVGGVSSGLVSAAKSAAVVGRQSAAAASAERTYFQEAKARSREARGVGRVFRGGAMLGMMGLEAGMNVAQAAFGEGPGGGFVKTAGGVVGGTIGGAMSGAMIGGAPGAVVGGAVGLISSATSAIMKANEGVGSAFKLTAAAIDAATKALDQHVAVEWQVAQAAGVTGVEVGNFAEIVEFLSKRLGASSDVISDVFNAIADRATNAGTVAGAMNDQVMHSMLSAMAQYKLSADQMGEIAVAADDANVPLTTFLQLLDAQAGAAVRAGKAETRSGYIHGVVGGLGGMGTAAEMGAAAMLGPEFGQVTEAIASGDVSDKERRARAAHGVTEGMSADQQRAVLGSAAAGGADLKGTGLEKFTEVLAAFGEKGGQFEALGNAMMALSTMQEVTRVAMDKLAVAVEKSAAAAKAQTEALEAWDAETAGTAEAERASTNVGGSTTAWRPGFGARG